MNLFPSILSAGLVLGGLVGAAAAPNIPSWTVDGGGGRSTGARFSVIGTLGQADAGRMTGSRYSVAGGFWTAAIQTPGGPPLDVAKVDNRVRVFWPKPSAGWILQTSTNLQSWTNSLPPYLDDGTNFYFESTPNSSNPWRFYRLRPE